MAADERVTQLEEFLVERGQPLLRVAVLLGGGPEAGEDLLQAALERLLRRWRRFEGDPEGYLRRTLYHTPAVPPPAPLRAGVKLGRRAYHRPKWPS
jgi:DNA-directed RNA polymerase specialized sigma24 family protein